MRSRLGVGITPPNVLETPKPVSSVMINRTFGAPLGGTTRAGQYGVDCAVLRSILPSNFCGGGGSWLPSIVVVALGEPGTSVTCCAIGGDATGAMRKRRNTPKLVAARHVRQGESVSAPHGFGLRSCIVISSTLKSRSPTARKASAESRERCNHSARRCPIGKNPEGERNWRRSNIDLDQCISFVRPSLRSRTMLCLRHRRSVGAALD